MRKLKILTIFGTRPEAIKMVRLVQLLKQQPHFEAKLCVTGQHRDMLDQVMHLFEIQPDYDLNVMKVNQDLTELHQHIALGLKTIFTDFKPDLVLVHGDTTTTLASALTCYYHQIDVAHVEAGLRTGNIYSPWPEEGNRQLVSMLAKYHFVPTQVAKDNLLKENKDPNRIFLTGNTVIDALFWIRQKMQQEPTLLASLEEQFKLLQKERKLVLITLHRRENLGAGAERIYQAIGTLIEKYPEINFVYPMHLNPKFREIVKEYLKPSSNLFLLEPLAYLPFVYLMDRSHLILTDSGGIQEEASSLGKPILVLRESTERSEGLSSGIIQLAGTDKERIVNLFDRFINDDEYYRQIAKPQTLFGDGTASEQIINIITALEK